MTQLEFTIDKWSSWGLGNSANEAPPAKPDVSWVPAMMRRRLGATARAVFHTAHECLEPEANASMGARLPTVLCSDHSEAPRNFDLLTSIATDQPLSPASFSLSVHNAIAGQLSIATRNKAASSAIAAGNTGLLAGFVEAATITPPGSDVLLVFYENELPAFYQPDRTGPDSAIAVALKLRFGGNTENRQCALHKTGDRLDTTALHEQISALGDWLAQGENNGALHISAGGLGWALTRPGGVTHA